MKKRGAGEIFDGIRREAGDYYSRFWAKNKAALTAVLGAAAIAVVLGVIAGASNAERYIADDYFLLRGAGTLAGGRRFAVNFLLHTAYFAVVYVTVVNFYCSAAGFITVAAVAFKLGASAASLVAISGLGGFINALVIYLPVNAAVITCLTGYLLVCIENSGLKKRGVKYREPRYSNAAKQLVYFLTPALLVDLAAFVLIL
ncbi:MAG: hypothetical protein LBQ40_05120 [Clostridiales bacterium]|jgi:hypothetical protein|nr:hypothetical protein [Clostridiales bacterium]